MFTSYGVLSPIPLPPPPLLAAAGQGVGGAACSLGSRSPAPQGHGGLKAKTLSGQGQAIIVKAFQAMNCHEDSCSAKEFRNHLPPPTPFEASLPASPAGRPRSASLPRAPKDAVRVVPPLVLLRPKSHLSRRHKDRHGQARTRKSARSTHSPSPRGPWSTISHQGTCHIANFATQRLEPAERGNFQRVFVHGVRLRA